MSDSLISFEPTGRMESLGIIQLYRQGVIMNKKFLKFVLVPISLLAILPAYSATQVNLLHKTSSTLTQFLNKAANVKLEEISRNLDFNQTLHIRLKETYLGYQVWGGDAI